MQILCTNNSVQPPDLNIPLQPQTNMIVFAI